MRSEEKPWERWVTIKVNRVIYVHKVQTEGMRQRRRMDIRNINFLRFKYAMSIQIFRFL